MAKAGFQIDICSWGTILGPENIRNQTIGTKRMSINLKAILSSYTTRSTTFDRDR